MKYFTTLLLLGVIVVAGGIAEYQHLHQPPTDVLTQVTQSNNPYATVILKNGQAYVGKVIANSADTIDLRNVYYVQAQVLGSGSSTNSIPTKITLYKLSNEIHSPTDRLLINRQQVNNVEALTTDSELYKLVQQSNNQ